MLCCAVPCGAVLWCVVGGSSCAVSGHFGRTHTPYNWQGPYQGPTWGCPTALRSYSRTGNPSRNNDPQALPNMG